MESNSLKIKKGKSLIERQGILERWRESGKSKKDFCSEHGINYYTLMSWLTPSKNKLKPLKPDQTLASFSEVKLPQKNSSNLFARISIGKSSVDLYQPVSADFLWRLLTA